VLVLSLLLVGLIVAFDVWLFAGIRRALRRRPPRGRSRSDQPAPERSYA